MATITKALLDLLTNPKTQNFAKSLKHSDLPDNWTKDPEIVDLAAKAWQEAGTDSPFFKAWFGDYINDPDNASQVVTSAGLPQVVYHGVRPGGTMFDTFDMSRSRDIGAHFSGDRNVAEKFANGNWIGGFWIKDKKLENPIVHDVYLNARQLEETGDIYSNAGELENTLENLYGSGLIDRGVFDKLIGKAKKGDNLYYKMDETRNWGENRTVKSFWKDLNKEMQKKKNGAKGAYYKNDFEGGNDYSYTVFRPEQIKSVNNRGTFNPADPNIYRSLAPLGVGTAAMAASLLAGGDEAKAAAINAALADPASREKAAAAGLPYDPPVEESAWSPADLLVAPVGAVGIPAKLLAMALDAPVTLGLDAGLSALGGLFGGGDRKKPGGW